jgi:hypothetical protein
MPDPTVVSNSPSPASLRVASLTAALRACEAAPADVDVPRALLELVCAELVLHHPGDLALAAFSCAGAAGPVAIEACAGATSALAGLSLGRGEEPLTDLIGAALLQQRPVVCHRSRNDPAHARWGERAWRLGFATACAAPFEAGPGRSGVLAVFSPDERALGADELDLLVDIAAALARRHDVGRQF